MNFLVILNLNGRLNLLKPLLESIVYQGIGKRDRDLYIVSSGISISDNNSRESITFSLIQQRATMRGFNNVIYDLNEKNTTKKD